MLIANRQHGREWCQIKRKGTPFISKVTVLKFLNDSNQLFLMVVIKIFLAIYRQRKRGSTPKTTPRGRISEEFFIFRGLRFQWFKTERCCSCQPLTTIKPHFCQTIVAITKEFNADGMTIGDQEQGDIRIFRAAKQQQPVFR